MKVERFIPDGGNGQGFRLQNGEGITAVIFTRPTYTLCIGCPVLFPQELRADDKGVMREQPHCRSCRAESRAQRARNRTRTASKKTT